RFPNDSSKVAFAISFMTDYAATWSQPYLTKIFNGEAVVFSEFIDDFKSSFFDHNRRHHTEVALKNLCQTGTVLYQHGLKENIQLAVVMSNIHRPAPIPSSNAPTTNPNAMDLSAFQRGPNNQLSDAKRACRAQLNLCFRCGQAGHISCGCSNGNRKSQDCFYPCPFL
ncbi:uncharacterized protein VP01_8127g1, partial [Puccinia sorghi]